MFFHSVPCSLLHSECETSPSQMLSHSLFLCPGPVKQMKANRKLSSLLYFISEPSPREHATVFILFGLTLYTIYVHRLYSASPILMHLLLVHTFQLLRDIWQESSLSISQNDHVLQEQAFCSGIFLFRFDITALS